MTVSSAYKKILVVGSWGMSFRYKLNRKGLRTDPCGTPAAIVPGGERAFNVLILKDLLFKNDWVDKIRFLGKLSDISLNRRP